MGGSEPPYLYDPPSSRKIAYPYSDFNPKAVTEASYNRISTGPKPKKEGPLINFNRHPDSYVVVSGNQTDHKPLPSSTKKAVVSIRWVQFVFRLIQEIGALGLLVATICIKGTSGAETYLLRIPQAWDCLITLYAIYHLIRPAKSRTAASSASYHIFALIMDTALIPLYIYITLATNNNRQLPVPQYKASGAEVNGNWRWTSFFNTQSGTDLLLLVTFLASAVMAGLHLLSCGFDLYLAIIFRKIDALPPDMNPLEDNLTSRHTSKHKYKNSEATLTGSMSEVSDAEKKRLAHLSGSTLSVGDAMDERQVPFGHSRTGSKTNLAFSPHNPESARWSRHQFEGQQDVYRDAATPRSRNRYDIRPDGKLEVRTRHSSQSPSKRGSVISEHMDNTDRQSQNGSIISRNHDIATAGISSAAVPNAAPSNFFVKSEQKKELLHDNWYVLEDDTSDLSSISRNATPPPPPKSSKRRSGGYMPVHDRHDSFEPAGSQQQDAMLKPLGMHPPTPEPEDDVTPVQKDRNTVTRSMTAASNVTASSSVYSESAPSLKSGRGIGTPKGKYYGDLAAATRGIRLGNSSPANPYGNGLPPSPQRSRSRTPSPEKKARVISRTGADIADESVLYVPEAKYNMRSRRDVSGKVAEEGRGGNWGRGR